MLFLLNLFIFLKSKPNNLIEDFNNFKLILKISLQHYFNTAFNAKDTLNILLYWKYNIFNNESDLQSFFEDFIFVLSMTFLFLLCQYFVTIKIKKRKRKRKRFLFLDFLFFILSSTTSCPQWNFKSKRNSKLFSK